MSSTYTNLEYLGETSSDTSTESYQKSQSLTQTSAVIAAANNHAQTPLSVGTYFLMMVFDAAFGGTLSNMHVKCGMGASGAVKYLTSAVDEYTGGSGNDIVLSSIVKMTSANNCAVMLAVDSISGSGTLTLTIKRLALIKIPDDMTDFSALKSAIIKEQATTYTIDSGGTEVTLQGISAIYSGGNVVIGTALTELTGINVTANYSDGTSVNVTDYSLSGTIAEGNNTITVTYQEKTATFVVVGVKPEVILQGISATYTGGSVLTGTELSELQGITVTATYSDGSTENVTGYTLSGEIAEGNNTITVTYQGKTTTINVVGIVISEDITLQSISVTYTGGSVVVGTRLSDLVGITVAAIYSDGSTINVTDYSLSGTIAEGNNTITVIYQSKTATFTVMGVASGGDIKNKFVAVSRKNFDKIAKIANNIINSASFRDGQQVSAYGGLTDYNATDYTVYEFNAKIGETYTIAPVSTNARTYINAYTVSEPQTLADNYDWAIFDARKRSLTFTIPVASESSGVVRVTMPINEKNNAYLVVGTEYVEKTSIIAHVPYLDEKIKKIEEEFGVTPSDIRVVLCYGDSLTRGTGGDGTNYPSVLQELLGENYDVKNYGCGGETAQQIACRQGGVPMMVQPLECAYNQWKIINFKSVFGFEPNYKFAYQSSAGFYPCTIDGKDVTLYWDSDGNQTVKNNNAETLSIKRPTKIVPYSSTLRKNTCIIWCGTNGWGDNNIDTLVNTQKRMIDYNGNDNYIIIGLHTDTLSDKFVELETKMSQAFGEHFINIREYLVNYGLEDAGITATDSDTARISQGLVPSSLLADGLHFNAYGYTVIANVIYIKGKDLGLW